MHACELISLGTNERTRSRRFAHTPVTFGVLPVAKPKYLPNWDAVCTQRRQPMHVLITACKQRHRSRGVMEKLTAVHAPSAMKALTATSNSASVTSKVLDQQTYADGLRCTAATRWSTTIGPMASAAATHTVIDAMS